MDNFLYDKINEWRTEYPFLGQVWDLFNYFTNDITEKGNELFVVCDEDIVESYSSKKKEYTQYCKILLKNIWGVDGLKDLFPKNTKYTKCVYESYTSDYAKPEDAIKLSNFADNYDIIGEILMGQHPQQRELCLKYIYDCAYTYKKLNTLYCKNRAYQNPKYIKLCSDLESFNTTYNYLSMIESLIGKLPDLDTPVNEFIAALPPSVKTDIHTNEQTDFISGPLKSKITTGVTAGVGACAFLGILYKFTPARDWLSARNRAAKASILLDGGQNEMLYNSPDSWNMESDNKGYNIGYNSMEN
ncbi:PIR protein [Plasmodium vivax]|uniref:VIR protein n=1 Tax=Plasmodium vivax TaxID=5855 RepID=A0A564ZMV9_PLAVI|nr:PIR protein [Plasmodium vivax]